MKDPKIHPALREWPHPCHLGGIGCISAPILLDFCFFVSRPSLLFHLSPFKGKKESPLFFSLALASCPLFAISFASIIKHCKACKSCKKLINPFFFFNFHYNKRCPCISNYFIRCWVNSLVIMNETLWGGNEFISLVNRDYWLAPTFCSSVCLSTCCSSLHVIVCLSHCQAQQVSEMVIAFYCKLLSFASGNLFPLSFVIGHCSHQRWSPNL